MSARFSRSDESTPQTAVAVIAPESHRRFARRTVLFVLGGCLLIWFARRPEQLLHPYIWDEESQVIRHFIDDGWLGALRPVQGYMILPGNLLLPMAASLSFSHLPILAFWMATAVFALTVCMIVVPDSRWGSQHTRALMAFAMALCPTNPETFGVLLYSFWWATLWPVIILGWKRDLWWARMPLLVIAGLSSPAGAMMAVAFAMSFRITRRRTDLVSASVLGVGLVLQITSLMAGGRNGSVSTNPLLLIAQSLRTVGLFAWWTPHPGSDWPFSAIVGLVLLEALAAAAFALRQRHEVGLLLMLIAMLLFAGVSAAPLPLATNPLDAGPRYYFLPFVLLSWLLAYVWRESHLPAPFPALAGVFLATSLLGIWPTFSRAPASTTGRLDWQQQIVGCAASPAHLVKIPVYFDGSAGDLWSMTMTPSECGARL